jgi:hypothetical protein
MLAAAVAGWLNVNVVPLIAVIVVPALMPAPEIA